MLFFVSVVVFFIGHPDFQSPKTAHPMVDFVSLIQNWKTGCFSDNDMTKKECDLSNETWNLQVMNFIVPLFN